MKENDGEAKVKLTPHVAMSWNRNAFAGLLLLSALGMIVGCASHWSDTSALLPRNQTTCDAPDTKDRPTSQPPANDQPSDHPSHEYDLELKMDLKYLRSPAAFADYSNLVKNVERLEQKWRPRGHSYYCEIIHTAAGRLGSKGTREGDRLCQRYAKMALEQPGQTPLSLQCDLTLLLFKDIEYSHPNVGDKPWDQIRHEKAQFWLAAWQRLDRTIIKGFDLTVLPPATGVPKDAAEADAARRRSLETYTYQVTIHRCADEFKPLAERYLVTTYSRPPARLEELARDLDCFVEDRATRDRIVAQVTRNFQHEQTTSIGPSH